MTQQRPTEQESDNDEAAHSGSAAAPVDSPSEGFADLPDSLKAGLIQRQIPALNGVRTIAVFLVILMHYGFAWAPGAYGVVAFFVLSGFLITWLLLKEKQRYGRVSLTGFYKRRTLRIFPAFYAYWILWTMALIVTRREVPWPHAWSSFFYYSNYYNAILGDPNNGYSHTWSLAIEEQFYLLWPLGFLALSKSPRRMKYVLTAIIVIVWVYRVGLVSAGVPQHYLYAAFDTRFDALMVGCLLAVVLWEGSAARLWRLLTAHPVAPLVVLVLIILGINGFRLLGVNGSVYRDTVGHAIVPPLMALMIVQLVAFSASRWWSWIDAWPFQFLGTISYPLYLYQQVTTYPVKEELAGYHPSVQLLGTVGVTILFASASYYIIERPFLRLKQVNIVATCRQWLRARLSPVR
jgi:peptidoglycan/LPS O-acetylase OafA/YrhL